MAKGYTMNPKKRFYEKHKKSELDRNRIYRTKNKQKLSEKYQQYCKTLRGKFNKIIKDIRRRADTTITIEDLERMWERQNGLCALSGLQMTYNHNGPSPDAVSVDRIDPNGRYELNNIRLCTKWANMARSSLTDKEFVTWCKLILKKEKSNVSDGTAGTSNIEQKS